MCVKPQEQPQLRGPAGCCRCRGPPSACVAEHWGPCTSLPRPQPNALCLLPSIHLPFVPSKEGTHQPQEKHQEEKKELSRALLTTRGGTWLPQAWTQTFLPMGTAGLDMSLVLQPAFPEPAARPIEIATELQGRDEAPLSSSPSHSS